MSILGFVTLVDEGHEIEFVYEGRKYSAAYCKINEKIMISFCEFYKDSIEVEMVNKLLDIIYNRKKYLI